MATDEEGKAVSKVVLSERMTSKIREFASKHSDGIEDADKLQNVLEELLHKIISYRRTGKKFEGLRNTDMVEVAVVPVMEGLSVRIKVSGDELQELFKREIPQSEVEKCFLKLLGFHEPSGDAAISETKECNVGIGLKRVLLAFFVACVETIGLADLVVSDVTARQRYPWNGMVDIDYTITGDATGLKIEIGVEDRQNGKTYFPTKFLSALPVSAGRHRVTWSTEAEGVTIISTNVAVTVSLVKVGSEGTQTKCRYYVVDLSGGPTATRYPVTTMETSSEPEWTTEYKTTKLVLRRIEAGEDPLKRYTITKPFYIGVFEVTQKQYELVAGTNPSHPTYKGDLRAVNYVSYNDIRGDIIGSGWPNSSDVDGTSFLGILRNRTGIAFDLPTEAQWEYACRAGTTSSYNNGGDAEADLKILGRYKGNSNDGRGGYSDVTIVGAYAPNAWGLYDMHGNMLEWCLDWYDPYGSGAGVLTGSDPRGAASGEYDSYRVSRGGYYGWSANACTSSYRSGRQFYNHGGNTMDGFRLACPTGL